MNSQHEPKTPKQQAIEDLERAWREFVDAFRRSGVPRFLCGVWIGMVVMLVAVLVTGWPK